MAFYSYLSTKIIIMTFITKSYQNLFGVRSYINANVFIKGRCKNLLLTSSGQNIYPEEIESKLNNMPYVSESLIILQQDKLVGLIYPDSDDAFAHGLSQSDLVRVMEENRLELNKQLPAFSQIARFKLYPEEFEKTAKKSIKRFLYQDIKE